MLQTTTKLTQNLEFVESKVQFIRKIIPLMKIYLQRDDLKRQR